MGIWSVVIAVSCVVAPCKVNNDWVYHVKSYEITPLPLPLFIHYRAIADLEEEKKRRTKAEEAHRRTMLQFEMVRAEMERLKEQVKQQTYQYQQQLHHQNER